MKLDVGSHVELARWKGGFRLYRVIRSPTAKGQLYHIRHLDDMPLCDLRVVRHEGDGPGAGPLMVSRSSEYLFTNPRRVKEFVEEFPSRILYSSIFDVLDITEFRPVLDPLPWEVWDNSGIPGMPPRNDKEIVEWEELVLEEAPEPEIMFDVESYRLLGTEVPFTWDQPQFLEWVEAVRPL